MKKGIYFYLMNKQEALGGIQKGYLEVKKLKK
jgi:hypothetical protein